MRATPDWTTRVAWVFLAAACGVLAVAPATAIEFRGGKNVVVGVDEVIRDDLYTTGETVTVEGRVEGDLIASGREVRMNGEVTGDLLVAAQAVVVNGLVGDDVRMAGMALQLGPEAAVGDDVVAAGMSLETMPESLTGGVLLFTGLQALLAGEIQEGLVGAMNGLEIRGGIGGDGEVEVGEAAAAPGFLQYIPSPVAMPSVAGGLSIGDGARIGGSLVYTSPSEARGSGAGSGSLTRREPASVPAEAGEVTRKSPWPGRFFKWVGLVVLGLLLAWRVPGWLEERSGEIASRPLPLAGIGLLGFAALPVVAIFTLVLAILLAVILGLIKLGNLAALAVVLGLVGLGLLIFLFWLTASYLAPILVGLCTGRWALKRVAADKASRLALPLVAGLVLLALLRFVPFLGFLVALAVVCVGWGAMLVWLWKRSRPGEEATA